MKVEAKHIPPEVVEAAREAFFSDKGMRGAIAAGLAAWPEARVQEPIRLSSYPATIILPLPQEASDV